MHVNIDIVVCGVCVQIHARVGGSARDCDSEETERHGTMSCCYLANDFK